ncbi:hypothetical protein AYL99_03574 [Fonsecaea erecta]|uniref:Alpha/beta hydrolase fold-3 domain-containing protein n=1 Tax=Fonsecaea erecta TaxID=1367422 RepID=A0A178ZPI1_9EURO|nr:hypothetical protein AYL99_03574 [Fonsecaea erecta]OAP61371.1 hypothetical protein AYL99_03574 [Fonsecaea erecta]
MSRPSFYLYNHGISPNLLTLGTLVYKNYADPELRSDRADSESDFAELEKRNQIISQSISGCFVATKDTKFGLGIEALDLATVGYEYASKCKKLVVAKSGRRVILGNNDSVDNFFEKVIQDDTILKRLTRWLSVAKSQWIFYAATFQKPKVFCVTGFYELEEVMARTDYSHTHSATLGVSSAVIGAATGVPIGGNIGPLKDGRSLKANVVLEEKSIWAARFHQLKVEYIQMATAATTTLPSTIMLYEDCTHPRGALMNEPPVIEETRTVELEEDISMADAARVGTRLEEIEEIPDDADPGDNYWRAFEVAETRLMRAEEDSDDGSQEEGREQEEGGEQGEGAADGNLESRNVFSPDQHAVDKHGPRDLLVHFPPGPSIGTHDTPSSEDLAQLQHSFPPSTSLVSISYRLGNSIDPAVPPKESTCFPVPVHDVSTAFDYLTSPTSPFNVGFEGPPKICLLGRNIGGALATMLALTKPNEIHALAVIEPMVDWTGLDDVVEQLRVVDTSSPSQKRQKQKVASRYGVDTQSVIAAAEQLIRLRSRLFETPSAYFDPFASPMLFLRASGKDTPLSTTVASQSIDHTALDQLDSDGDYDSLGSVDGGSRQRRYSTQTGSPDSPHDTGQPPSDENGSNPISTPTSRPRRRKVLRRWPTVGLPESVTLPYVRIFLESPTHHDIFLPSSEAQDLTRGHAALMRGQGLEMAELMRRACFLGREKSFAEERVHVREQGPEDRQRMDELEQGSGRCRTGMQENAIEWIAGMFARD